MVIHSVHPANCGYRLGGSSVRPIRIARLEIDHVSVAEAEFPGVLHFDTDQWPCYLVAEVKAGAVRIGSAARGERCTAGDVALAARPGRSCSAETEGAQVSLTALPPEALQRIIGDPARLTGVGRR
ncbi:hypothetical protein CRM90_22350 [Mycobacterium sp. ENV421]|uniref:hypothetical protein n=1 Tax=Mycobacterium sp. ENV421 TaxID=1213407 RepID=UPI000C9A5AC6|nr:hypothetical protein [Mycobacterium sp. ENV421]PND55501.1 hypothetical protein CRM90_22350 [Mycobacterium sp. ENV421]